ncbi:MAG: hypothetical protein AAF467_16925 [Actinomycetota bacterium]
MAPVVEGSEWLNVDPITWSDLRGRAVVVLFWSFGCEASLLRVRQLEILADRWDGELVVLAVHTPRFPYEEDADEVRLALSRYRIRVPVLHDPEYITWNRYNPDGWPATVTVDPRGRVLGTQAGTSDVALLADSVTLALETSPHPVEAAAPQARLLLEPVGPVAFPTSVTVRSSGELVVADTGNDRLLLFEFADDLRRAIAVAEIDGFEHPSAVAADAHDGLFVAETATGAISYLDLERSQRQLLTNELVAPTGLEVDVDGSLVVTDAGAERLYRLIVASSGAITMGLIAGSGTTGSTDGTAAEAALAQPVGVARTEVGLVFCDAASSNVRLLTDRGRVATITGNGFFEWGLVDGPAHRAMFQRPSDLTVLPDGSIVIVDTGNNRLRRLANRRIRTLGLSGLRQPAGVCALADGHLLVADTGNHRIVVVDTDLQTAWPLELVGVPVPGERRRLSSPTA